MGKDTRRRNKKKRRIAETCMGDGVEQRPTTRIVDIPDDLLELIFLHVRTPTCVVRAAATCKLWRRVIAGDGFHHRFRSRHGHGFRLLLGYYSVCTEPLTGRIITQFVPSPRRRAMAMGLLRQRFSVDFLIRRDDTSYTKRVLTDSRGGLLAFVRDNNCLIVCDPRTRRYLELYFPWKRPPTGHKYSFYFNRCLGCFFLDARDGDSSRRSPLSRFKVVWASLFHDNSGLITAQACVFSARDHFWLPPSFSDAISSECRYMCDMTSVHNRFVGRAGGSIFWAGGQHVLVLSESTGEFSAFKLPSEQGAYTPCCSKNLRVIAGGVDGAVRIVRVVDGDALEVLTVSRAHGGWDCMVERRAGLNSLANIDVKPDHGSWRFLDTTMASGLLVLGVFSMSSTDTLLFSFSFEVDTMTLHPETNRMTLNTQRVLPYELPWPKIIQ